MEDRNSTLKASLKRFLTNAWDLFMLNICWIVCSLPVLTMGPATSALFSVLLKIVQEEPVAPVKEFFQALKRNFKQAFVLGLIALLVAFVGYVDYQYAILQDGTFKTVFLIVTGILAALWLIFVTYVFPLQARFENTLKGHVLNAFAMAIVAPGKTVSAWLILAFPILAVLVYPDYAITYLGWLYFMYGASLPFYWVAGIVSKVFQKIEEGKKPHDET